MSDRMYPSSVSVLEEFCNSQRSFEEFDQNKERALTAFWKSLTGVKNDNSSRDFFSVILLSAATLVPFILPYDTLGRLIRGYMSSPRFYTTDGHDSSDMGASPV